jgi:hypothetical protein
MVETLQDQWKSKLRVTGKESVYTHFRCVVEILSGDPPDAAILLAANDWQDVYFGGRVEYKYAAPDDGGQMHRYAAVKIYTD